MGGRVGVEPIFKLVCDSEKKKKERVLRVSVLRVHFSSSFEPHALASHRRQSRVEKDPERQRALTEKLGQVR